MATITTRKTKDGKKRFRVEVRMAGFRFTRATFDSMASARAWAAQEETRLRERRHGLGVSPNEHTAAEMIDRFCSKVLRKTSSKKRYIQQVERQLGWWREKIGRHQLGAISKATIVEQMEELSQRVSNETVNRYISAISKVFSHAVTEWEWLAVSPMAGIRRLPEAPGRDRYLREHERVGIIEACQRENKKPMLLLVVLGMAIGGRKHEVRSILLDNLRMEEGMAIATQDDTKNKRKKTFYITGWAFELLRDYLQRLPATRKTKYLFPNRFGDKPMEAEREWRRIRNACGLEDFRFHDLRHTFGSYMAMNGSTPQEIAEALNQKTLEMAMRYAHLAPGHVEGKVAAMNSRIFNQHQQGSRTS